jgi:hypothetical protein
MQGRPGHLHGEEDGQGEGLDRSSKRLPELSTHSHLLWDGAASDRRRTRRRLRELRETDQTTCRWTIAAKSRKQTVAWIHATGPQMSGAAKPVFRIRSEVELIYTVKSYCIDKTENAASLIQTYDGESSRAVRGSTAWARARMRLLATTQREASGAKRRSTE